MYHTVDDATLRMFYSVARGVIKEDDHDKIGTSTHFKIKAEDLVKFIDWVIERKNNCAYTSRHYEAMKDALAASDPMTRIRLPRVVAAVLTYDYWVTTVERTGNWYDWLNVSPLFEWEIPETATPIAALKGEVEKRSIEEEIEYMVGAATEEHYAALRSEMQRQKERLDSQRTNYKVLDAQVTELRLKQRDYLYVGLVTALAINVIGSVIFYYYFN